MSKGRKGTKKARPLSPQNRQAVRAPVRGSATPELPLLLATIELKKIRWKYLGPALWLVLLIIILFILIYAPKDRVTLILEFIKIFKINVGLVAFFFISLAILVIFKIIGKMLTRQNSSESEIDLEV